MTAERPPWEETWRIGDDKNDIFTGEEHDPNMEIVCYGAPIPRNYLIAAAPDLYRALADLCEYHTTPDRVWMPGALDAARAALAKARGTR